MTVTMNAVVINAKMRIPKLRQGNKVCVQWHDAFVRGGWREDNDLEDMLDDLPGEPCETLGIFYQQDKGKIAVALSRSGEGGWADIMFIPKSMIHNIRVWNE